MGWLAITGLCLGILAAIVLLLLAGYRVGRDSRMAEIEDRADDRVYALREKCVSSINETRKYLQDGFKESCLGELEAYRFRVQREVRDAIQKVPLTVEDAVKGDVGSEVEEATA